VVDGRQQEGSTEPIRLKASRYAGVEEAPPVPRVRSRRAERLRCESWAQVGKIDDRQEEFQEEEHQESMKPSKQAEKARQLVTELYDAWSLHEPDRIDSIFTDDATYEDVAGGQVFRGKGEIKQLLRAAFAFAPDFRVTLRSLVLRDDTAATEWELEGTQTGPASVGQVGDFPATGRAFRLRGASVLALRQGRIAQVTDYYDMATFLRQLGGTFQPPTSLPQ